MLEIRANQLSHFDIAEYGLPIPQPDGTVKCERNPLWDFLKGQEVVVTGYHNASTDVQQFIDTLHVDKTFAKKPIDWKSMIIIDDSCKYILTKKPA